MAATFSQLAILFLFLSLGVVLGRIKHISVEKSNLLSMLLVNVFLPCKVFSNFSTRCTASYLKNNRLTLLISLGFLLFLVLFSWVVSKRLTREAYERRLFRYSFTIANYSYLGYVFVEAVLGAQALTDMILFCIPFAFYTYTFGYSLLTAREGSVSIKRAINPMTVALLLGAAVGVSGIALPGILTTALGNASTCVGPLSMILTGIVIASFPWRELLPDGKTWIFAAMRLAVIPAMLLLICKLLDLLGILTPAIYPIVVIMGCMPCGLNTIVFPVLIGEDCKLGARFVLLSHILCLVTIPLWMWILI